MWPRPVASSMSSCRGAEGLDVEGLDVGRSVELPVELRAGDGAEGLGAQWSRRRGGGGAKKSSASWTSWRVGFGRRASARRRACSLRQEDSLRQSGSRKRSETWEHSARRRAITQSRRQAAQNRLRTVQTDRRQQQLHRRVFEGRLDGESLD